MVTVARDTNVVVALRENRAMTEPNMTPLADTTCERDTAKACTTRHELVEVQGVCLATTFDDLRGETDATDETADDIVRAVRAWRDVMSSRTLD
jgi:hypothetical protein